MNRSRGGNKNNLPGGGASVGVLEKDLAGIRCWNSGKN
jgi:hypothetical protein